MALQILAADSTGIGIRVDLATTDDAYVASDVIVGSTSSTAIFGTGSGHAVEVDGTAVGALRAISLGDSLSDFGQQVIVGQGAHVSAAGFAGTAVVVEGQSSLVDNRGSIYGESCGLGMGGSGGSQASVISNSGFIGGGHYAVYRVAGSNDTIELHNTGEIRAASYTGNAYFGDDNNIASDVVVNSGLMFGRIELGGGVDFYDGSLGRVYGHIDGGSAGDVIRGGAFLDEVTGGDGNDELHGGGGDDELDGEADDDFLFGDAGNDTLYGGAGADRMSGGSGNDDYEVDGAGDVVDETGGGGIDSVSSARTFSLTDAAHAKGGIENLVLYGNGPINGTGNALANSIWGADGANVLNGMAGNDMITAAGGADTIFGGNGNDQLYGGAGTDRLHGGVGNDRLTGGANVDFFIFDTAPHAATNRDVVTDFVHGQDRFQLENAVFGALGAAGGLKSAHFWNGAAAHDADDHVIYNRATGALSYDSDGSGAHAAFQFATLMGKPLLAASDFAII